jgi:uncharacterized protein (TIGR00369 family)
MSRSTTVTWQDPRILSDAALTMEGFEFLRAICDGRLPPPPMAELLGFRLAQVEKGQVVFECEPGEQHYNPIGVVHGGLAMTMLDSCMACAVQTMVPPGSGYTTLEAKVNLVRAITNGVGKLRAIGRKIHVGNRVGTAEGRLEDASGKLYAHGTTTCIVLSNGK